MSGNHTLEANQRCFDLANQDLAPIWDELHALGPDAGQMWWKEKIVKIATEYTLSARFALMRILSGLAAGLTTGQTVAERDFSVVTPKGELTFAQITAAHAANLTPQELRDYLALILGRIQDVAERRGGEVDAKAASALVRKALATRKNTSLLTREELMELGHLLGLNLETMQWLLLRTLDLDDGFRFNRAFDLMDAYGFIMDRGVEPLTALKDAYTAAAPLLPKYARQDREMDWKQDMEDSLPAVCRKWTGTREEQDAAFLAWLTEKAPYLDVPSQSALTVYRNLAVAVAYGGADVFPENPTLARAISRLVDSTEENPLVREKLYRGGAVSLEGCANTAEIIMKENMAVSLSLQSDRAKAYRVITTRKTGAPSIGAGINKSRTRIQDLLYGSVEVQKSDLLYLVWILANLVWLWEDDNGDRNRDGFYNKISRSECMQELINAADIALQNALLPPFYPPHLMEQSMMLAIAYAGEEDPAVVYDEICGSVPDKRGGGEEEGGEEDAL